MVAPLDILCNATTGDRVVQLDDANGVVEGALAIAQLVRSRLRRWFGEYRLNVTSGVNWALLRTRPLDRAKLEGHLRRVLASIDGVQSILSLQVVVDRATREATLTASLRVDTGEVTEVIVEV